MGVLIDVVKSSGSRKRSAKPKADALYSKRQRTFNNITKYKQTGNCFCISLKPKSVFVKFNLIYRIICNQLLKSPSIILALIQQALRLVIVMYVLLYNPSCRHRLRNTIIKTLTLSSSFKSSKLSRSILCRILTKIQSIPLLILFTSAKSIDKYVHIGLGY